MDAAARKPKRRPRVSLLSMFLFTALVASSVAAWRSSNEAAELGRENARLHWRLGGLDMDDPSRGYARLFRGSNGAPGSFLWQVYTPPNIPTRLVLQWGDDWSELPLPGRYCSVSLSCVLRGDEWHYGVSLEDSAITFPHQRSISGTIDGKSPLAPPWIDPGPEVATFECLGPWPMEPGFYGRAKSWDALSKGMLIDAEHSTDEGPTVVRLLVEPVTRPTPVR